MKKNYMLDHSSGNRVFFTDGCNDLTREERFRYGIWPDVAPLSVTVNGEKVTDIHTVYGVDAFAEEFVLKKGKKKFCKIEYK